MEVVKNASNFEAVKLSLRQNKNGVVVSFLIHPNELPTELLEDWVGSRYMIALVRLEDDGTPTERKRGKLVTSAGALCRHPKFQDWLYQNGVVFEKSEESAAVFVRDYCGVASRSELEGNQQAAEKFMRLRDEFSAFMQGAPTHGKPTD